SRRRPPSLRIRRPPHRAGGLPGRGATTPAFSWSASALPRTHDGARGQAEPSGITPNPSPPPQGGIRVLPDCTARTSDVRCGHEHRHVDPVRRSIMTTQWAPPPPPPAAQARPRSRVGAVLLVVIGSVLALMTIGLLAGGGF